MIGPDAGVGGAVGPVGTEGVAGAPAFTYKPYGDYVQVTAGAARMQGGIIIPDAARNGFLVADVIAAGPDCKLVKKGNRILLHPQGIVRARHDGVEVAFTKEDKILAVVENVPETPDGPADSFFPP